jgi:hypothetical protein
MNRRLTLDAYVAAHPREPRCFSWAFSGLVMLAAVVAGNAVLILEAVK